MTWSGVFHLPCFGWDGLLCMAIFTFCGFCWLYPPKTSGKKVCVVICCSHLLHELGLWGVVCVVWCVVWSDVVCGVSVCRMLPSSLAQTWFISYCMRCMMCILEWCGVWGMSSLVLYRLISCRLWRTLITLWLHLDFSLGTGLDKRIRLDLHFLQASRYLLLPLTSGKEVWIVICCSHEQDA